MANLRRKDWALIASTCILQTAFELGLLPRVTPKVPSAKNSTMARIGMHSEALGIRILIITRMTIPSVATMKPTRNIRRRLLRLMITGITATTWNLLLPFHLIFLLGASSRPSSKSPRIRLLPLLRSTERAHTLLITTSTRLPEAIRNALALAVSLTTRRLLALNKEDAPRMIILLSRTLSRTAVQMMGQLSKRPLVKVKITPITHLASRISLSFHIAVLLIDPMGQSSENRGHPLLQSRINLHGRTLLILSQQSRSQMLLATPLLRVQPICLVSYTYSF